MRNMRWGHAGVAEREREKEGGRDESAVPPATVVLVALTKLFATVCLVRRYTFIQWRTQELCSREVQQIQLRTERTGIWGR